MAKFQLPETSTADFDRPRNMGHVTLQVESFDNNNNSVTGTDPLTGEEMTVRMATKDEVADVYADRRRFTTEEQRHNWARSQTKKQPTTRSLGNNMMGDGAVVQMQNVRELPDGDLIARWANFVTTDPSIDTYKRAEIDVHIPKNNSDTKSPFERRFATILFPDDARSATPQSVTEMTQNRVVGDDGGAPDAMIRSSVLVTVSDGSLVESGMARTSFDHDTKSFNSGPDALFDAKLDRFNWMPMAALAGRLEKPFEELTFDTESRRKIPEPDKTMQMAKAVYDATQRGELDVVVTPGVTADLMKHVTEKVLRSEANAEKNPNAATLSDRRFYTADVGFRVNEGQNDYPDALGIKEIHPSERLYSKSSEMNVQRNERSIGETALQTAQAREETRMVTGPEANIPEPPKPTADQAAEQERKKTADNSAGFAPATNGF
tara:strand:+ start:28989 stop:30293 length:1305 start_codon:yes stop_codon:yes gene_type:complete